MIMRTPIAMIIIIFIFTVHVNYPVARRQPCRRVLKVCYLEQIMATPIQLSRVPIRPMPKVDFPGRFRLCDEKRCIGQKCTFAHSTPELEAWNAQKGIRKCLH